jgi:hypothetical protein
MSGDPNYLILRDAACWQSRWRHKSRPGPRPTLGDLQRLTPGSGYGASAAGIMRRSRARYDVPDAFSLLLIQNQRHHEGVIEAESLKRGLIHDSDHFAISASPGA